MLFYKRRKYKGFFFFQKKQQLLTIKPISLQTQVQLC